MSDSSQAVFLSYASQDAVAVQRIAEALRAAGVEVWFDQNELAGGDAWDQKIKKQIRECALFMPVISASTNARLEGYFRREWKLAVERTHDMADEKAFLLPVVIDATSDAAASVPEKFRDVQWTRLPSGETPETFCARVRRLLGGEGRDPSPRRPSSAGGSNHGRLGETSLPRKSLRLVLGALVVLGLVAVAYLALRPTSNEPSANAAATPTPAPSDKSLAVLPFTNMSDDRENAYFADGVHEDLLTNLASLSALKVVSRTSVMQYRNTKKNVREIARELGVTYVLEGSVRRAGNTIRVTGQLIKAATDEHLWAKNYDRDLKDVFAVQSELAREIAGALNAALSPTETSRLEVQPTKNVDAYDCLQKARVLTRGSGTNEQDLREKVLPLLERAVELDPGYAAAWAELCGLQAQLYSAVDHSAARLTLARDALAHAMQLAPDAYVVLMAASNFNAMLDDRPAVNAARGRILELFPNRPEAHVVTALTAAYELRWADALASYRAALQIDPRNPEALENYFSVLDSFRRWDEAEPVARTLADVQPDNRDLRLTAASMIFRRDGSTAELTRLLATLPHGADESGNIISVRLRIAFLTGDWAGIVALWRESGPAFRTGGLLQRQARLMVVAAFLRLGDAASARPLLERNRDEMKPGLEADPKNFARLNESGLVLGMLGDRPAARAALDRAAELIATDRRGPVKLFGPRWDNTVARSWVDEKSSVIAKLGPLLREPTPHRSTDCARVLRVHWTTVPLHGDPEFEAMLNDPKNNAPLL